MKNNPLVLLLLFALVQVVFGGITEYNAGITSISVTTTYSTDETLTSTSGSYSDTIIQCGINSTIITIQEMANVTVSNIQITSCFANIFTIKDNATLNLINVYFTNTTGSGSKISCTGSGTINIINSLFTYNSVSNGFIFSAGACTINVINSIFNNNEATGKGSFLYANAASTLTLTIDGSSFSNNKAATSGGVFQLSTGLATVTVLNSNFTSNSVTKTSGCSGTDCVGGVFQFQAVKGTFSSTNSRYIGTRVSNDGAVVNIYQGAMNITLVGDTYYNNGGTSSSSSSSGVYLNNCQELVTLLMEDVTMEKHISSNGGPLSIYYCSVTATINRCTFKDNNVSGSGGSGGAIRIYEQLNDIPIYFTITSSTFSGNYANQGAAIYGRLAILYMSIQGSTFTGNSGNQGTLFFTGMQGDTTLNLDSIDISNNNIPTGSGVMYNYGNFNFNAKNFTGSSPSTTSSFIVGGPGVIGDFAIDGAVFANINGATIDLYGGSGSGGASTIPTISIKDLTMKSTTSSNQMGIVLDSINTQNALIDDFYCSDNIGPAFGSCISFKDSNVDQLIINNVYAVRNTANQGGAFSISSFVGSITIKNSIFQSNSATLNAGAILVKGCQDVFIDNCTFDQNGAGTYGGVIDFSDALDTVQIQNSNFTNNTASLGGVIYASQTDLPVVLRNNIFRNNVASNTGGVISFQSSTFPFSVNDNSNIFENNQARSGGVLSFSKHTGTIRLLDATFKRNKATNTGGVASFSESNLISISSCIFEENSASNYGGGIWFSDMASKFDITNCSFSKNTAAITGSGIYIFGSTSDFSVSSSFAEGVTGKGAISINSHSGSSLITSSTFSNNQGGAIYASSYVNEFSIANSSFSGNSVGSTIIFEAFHSSCQLTHLIFTNNNVAPYSVITVSMTDSSLISIDNAIFKENNGGLIGCTGTCSLTSSTLASTQSSTVPYKPFLTVTSGTFSLSNVIFSDTLSSYAIFSMDNMLLTGCHSIKIVNCTSEQTAGSGEVVDVTDICLKLGTANGSNCIDVDECSANNGGCDSHAICTNTFGSFNCTCKNGFTGDGTICIDINECSTNNGGCDSHAICTNTQGSFGCACGNGYEGNGIKCSDINECLLSFNNCHSQAYCTNIIGSFSCTCKGGFSGNGVSCDDVDECSINNGGCDSHAICTNIQGSFNCSCKNGYTGDGMNCLEIDPSKNEKDESNRAVGIGVGVSFGFLAILLLVLFIVFLLRRKKQKERLIEKQKNDSFRETNLDNISLTQNTTILGGETTLINTKFELSMPGFMNIDFMNQIRKEEKIGGGGTAVIYRGVILDPKLREKFDFKDVAIKQMLEDQRFSPEDNKLKFEQEIAIIWGISSHPNVLTLVGYSENPRCIITKLYNQDLYQYIKNTTANISSDIILGWARDIASGMNMVHSNRIVHRDLKSSNILLEVQNSKMNAIICDFGLARVSSEKNMLNQKIVDVKGFSPRYTAPEVFGRVSISAAEIVIEDEMKSDVYSYALILWEMMARKIPWANLKETAEIDFQIRSGKREPIPDTTGDKTLELLSTIIELSWDQIPSKRPTFNQIDQKLSPITSL